VGRVRLLALEGDPPMDGSAMARTLVHLLRLRAREQPGRLAVHRDGRELVLLARGDDRSPEAHLRRHQAQEREALLADPGPAAQRARAPTRPLAPDEVAGASARRRLPQAP